MLAFIGLRELLLIIQTGHAAWLLCLSLFSQLQRLESGCRLFENIDKFFSYDIDIVVLLSK